MTISPIRFGAFHPVAKVQYEGHDEAYEAGKLPEGTGVKDNEFLRRRVSERLKSSAEELAKLLNGEHPYESDREGLEHLADAGAADVKETMEYGPLATAIRDQFREADTDYRNDPVAAVVDTGDTVGIATGPTARTLNYAKENLSKPEKADLGFMQRLTRFLWDEIADAPKNARPGKELSVTLRTPHSHARYVTAVEMAEKN